jgi:pilus assembly protein CpaE
MNSSIFRKIHVLVLRGENITASERYRAAISPEEALRNEPGFQLTVGTAVAGRVGPTARNVRPDVIVVESHRDDCVELISELDEAVSETPVVVLLDEAERDQVQACVVAGARGCLVRPFDGETLATTLLQVHNKASRRRRLNADAPHSAKSGGRIIAVRGAKGGVGATAIATSLAVALARRAKQATALVDGHFFGGDIPVAMNLAPDRSIVDLIPHVDRIDEDLLSTTLVQHESGVAVLAAPHDFERAESIRAEDYQQVLEALRAQYGYVVIDCSPFLDHNTIAALDLADTVLLVTTPEIAALKNAARLIQLGVQLGYSERKMRLVVNRFNVAGAIARADFEEHLEYSTSFRLPNDAAVARALSRGVPVVKLQSGSSAARALDRLAKTIISNAGWEGEPRSRGRLVSRLIPWRSASKPTRPVLLPTIEAAS